MIAATLPLSQHNQMCVSVCVRTHITLLWTVFNRDGALFIFNQQRRRAAVVAVVGLRSLSPIIVARNVQSECSCVVFDPYIRIIHALTYANKCALRWIHDATREFEFNGRIVPNTCRADLCLTYYERRLLPLGV